MRVARSLAVCAAAALAAGGCDEAPAPDARFVATQEIKGFDPVFTSDAYASAAQKQVYEYLVEVHPFKRPLELMPLMAEAMPEISEDGKVYTFRIRGDAVFQDDPCFPGGKGRKVTAHDFVWCFKRLAAVPTSVGSWVLAGKVKGLDEWVARLREPLRRHLDVKNVWYAFEHKDLASLVAEEVPGMRALDDRTLRFELTGPYPVFTWLLSMNYGAVYPHEAVEHYGMTYLNHPVGCGPYVVKDYFVYDKKVVYVRNPTWHGQAFPSEGAPGDREAGLLDDAGRPLPFLDRIEFVLMPFSQPRWLKFVDGDLEWVETEKEIWARAMTEDGKLRPELAAKGIRIDRQPRQNIAFNGFNMADPVIGAPAGEKGKKIRQALALSFDRQRWIQIMRNGVTAEVAYGPIPPNVPGFQADVRSPYATRDIERAKRLLAEAGHPEGRGLPALTYELSNADATSRNGAEIFANCAAEIGIKVNLVQNQWPQFIAKVDRKQAQIFGMSWNADYPDAENFLQLFYGPNEAPGSNGTNYKNAEYDELYQRMAVMQPGPERDEVIKKMLVILNEDCPMSYTDCRVQYCWVQPWLKNFKYTDLDPWLFKYCRVDALEKRRRLAGEASR
jgi:peptide/nickel transport system substrate-binding protein